MKIAQVCRCLVEMMTCAPASVFTSVSCPGLPSCGICEVK